MNNPDKRSIVSGLRPPRVKDPLTAMLLPSVLGILLSAVCLAGGSFAWFTATETVSAPTIQAAKYDVSVAVSAGESAPVLPQGEIYRLAEPGSYTVTLTAVGDAATGYCILYLGDRQLHTVQFPGGESPGERITFTLEIGEAAELRIVPQWGSSAKPPEERLADGGTYSHPLSSEDGDTAP